MLKSAEGETASDETMGVRQPTGLIVLALATIYFVWGSTYLAIRVASETIPPFLMAGSRFIIAGLIAYGWAHWKGASRPSRREVIDAYICGGLLLLGGNGGVVWAMQTVPSAVSSLIVATVPLWVALFEWLRPGGSPPNRPMTFSLLLGFAGVTWLMLSKSKDDAGVPLAGGIVLLVSSLSWAVGSLYVRARAGQSREPFFKAIALQMLAGGSLLLLAALVNGDFTAFDPRQLSSESTVAMIYLIVAGSLISYTAYGWLLTVVRPTLVSTYAFVNPAVAVLIGYLVGEALSQNTLLAGGVVVTAVAFMVLARQ